MWRIADDFILKKRTEIMIDYTVIVLLFGLLLWMFYNNRVYHAKQANFYKQLWYRELSINCKLWSELNKYTEDFDLDYE